MEERSPGRGLCLFEWALELEQEREENMVGARR